MIDKTYLNTVEETATEQDEYIALKKEIARIFGQHIITAKECLMLSEDIYSKTSSLLSFNTLRRFFGLVKTKYPPSKATLRILSIYCGHNSIEDLEKHLETTAPKDGIKKNETLFNYVVTVFKNTPVNDVHDETFNTYISKVIQLFIHKNCFIEYTSLIPFRLLAQNTTLSMMAKINVGHLEIWTEERVYEFGPRDSQIKAKFKVLNESFWVRLLLLADLVSKRKDCRHSSTRHMLAICFGKVVRY